MSCCNFSRVTFIALGGQQCQHDNSLGQCVPIHLISTLFPPRYNIRWLIDGKFRGFAAKIDDFISIWMFRGGQRQISRGADWKYQYWYWTTINYNYSREGHQTADLCISERYLCSWKVLCAGKESNGGKTMQKFDDYVVNLGGRSAYGDGRKTGFP